jgi:hypothetical protein
MHLKKASQHFRKLHVNNSSNLIHFSQTINQVEAYLNIFLEYLAPFLKMTYTRNALVKNLSFAHIKFNDNSE